MSAFENWGTSWRWGICAALGALHNRSVRTFARLAILVGAAHIACRYEQPRSFNAQYRDAPIILISIDTLRADHLPVYGYGNGSTPVIDRLSHDALIFEDVYSHAALTLPSHASLMTGLLPPRHGVRDNIGYTLEAGQRTLAARFKSAGYATGGAVSASCSATDRNRRRLRFLRRRDRGERERRIAGRDAARRPPHGGCARRLDRAPT